MEITTDNWKGVVSNETTTHLVGSQQIITAIENLNGKEKTIVGISINDDIYILIGGRNEGRYVVTGNKGTAILNLINSSVSKTDNLIEIVAGGQAGMYETKYCINKETAIKAAITFFTSQSFDKILEWEVLE